MWPLPFCCCCCFVYVNLFISRAIISFEIFPISWGPPLDGHALGTHRCCFEVAPINTADLIIFSLTSSRAVSHSLTSSCSTIAAAAAYGLLALPQITLGPRGRFFNHGISSRLGAARMCCCLTMKNWLYNWCLRQLIFALALILKFISMFFEVVSVFVVRFEGLRRLKFNHKTA